MAWIKIVTPQGVVYFPDEQRKIVVSDCGTKRAVE
jgi:hypothetical protein